MKCPMLQRYLIQGENEAFEVFDDCLKEECAWWDRDNGQCGVMTLASYLGSVSIHLIEIEKKMPHE